jgi:hypothetical protein
VTRKSAGDRNAPGCRERGEGQAAEPTIPAMVNATGSFDVLGGSQDTYHEADGDPKLVRAHGNQRFSGDIEGEGSVEWLFCYPPEGPASFVGLQRIEGSVGGRRGAFVMESRGSHDGRASTGEWRIVPGSGTHELEGLSGTGEFDAPGGPKVSYRLDYDLDA